MKEMLELLNSCSPLRTTFYGIVFVISLFFICTMLSEMVGDIASIFKKK